MVMRRPSRCDSDSTRITSAPKLANTSPATGPAANQEKSATRMPASGGGRLVIGASPPGPLSSFLRRAERDLRWRGGSYGVVDLWLRMAERPIVSPASAEVVSDRVRGGEGGEVGCAQAQ